MYGELEKQIELLKNRITELDAEEPTDSAGEKRIQLDQELKRMQAEKDRLDRAWSRIQLARHEKRPYTLDYIHRIFQDFQEIHGDRRYADDPSMICGLAALDGKPVAVMGQQKGRDLKERQHRNFGCPNPEGYRKALRLMKLAEKFRLPVFTFIDTPGAYPSIGAEERGQAEAIALNLREMALLQTPILVTVIGEGGSGGALGIGVGDRVFILENSFYSVISPEGCSAILWKDQEHMREAAAALKITSEDLLSFGLVDAIIPEPEGGAHTDADAMAATLKSHLVPSLAELLDKPMEVLLDERYRRFRAMGRLEETC